MACGGCKKGGGNRHTSTNADLSRYAYLSPAQLRLRKQQEEAAAAEAAKKEEEGN